MLILIEKKIYYAKNITYDIRDMSRAVIIMWTIKMQKVKAEGKIKDKKYRESCEPFERYYDRKLHTYFF
jgi:hypothetical protein